MKKFLKNHWVKVVIGLAVVIAIYFIFFNFDPKKYFRQRMLQMTNIPESKVDAEYQTMIKRLDGQGITGDQITKEVIDAYITDDVNVIGEAAGFSMVSVFGAK